MLDDFTYAFGKRGTGERSLHHEFIVSTYACRDDYFYLSFFSSNFFLSLLFFSICIGNIL